MLRVDVARHVAMLWDCYRATRESPCCGSTTVPWEGRRCCDSMLRGASPCCGSAAMPSEHCRCCESMLLGASPCCGICCHATEQSSCCGSAAVQWEQCRCCESVARRVTVLREHLHAVGASLMMRVYVARHVAVLQDCCRATGAPPCVADAASRCLRGASPWCGRALSVARSGTSKCCEPCQVSAADAASGC